MVFFKRNYKKISLLFLLGLSSFGVSSFLRSADEKVELENVKFLENATVECSKIVEQNSNMWNELKGVNQKSQKHFVIVIPSYNNKDWYKKNLDSVFMQKYDNYNVIYIDDLSPDGTGDLVAQYIKEKRQEHRVLLIKNKVRCKALANIYNAINLCQDSDIIVSLDGDDWYTTDHVLSLLNIIYQNQNVMVTRGKYIRWPENEIKNCDPFSPETIATQAFRQTKGCPVGGLRTFYAGLFKKIKVEDLMYDGAFFPVAGDNAFMFPMFEMAGERVGFVSDLLYVANKANIIGDSVINQQLQIDLSKMIRNKMPYVVLPSDYKF